MVNCYEAQEYIYGQSQYLKVNYRLVLFMKNQENQITQAKISLPIPFIRWLGSIYLQDVPGFIAELVFHFVILPFYSAPVLLALKTSLINQSLNFLSC